MTRPWKCFVLGLSLFLTGGEVQAGALARPSSATFDSPRRPFELDGRLDRKMSAPASVPERVALRPVETRLGHVLFQSSLGGERFSPPILGDGAFFVSTTNIARDGATTSSRLLAIDSQSGRMRWSVEGEAGMTWPEVRGELVVVGDEKGRIRALDQRSSLERWRAEVGGPVKAALATDETRVWAASAHTLKCFSLKDGSSQWSQRLDQPIQQVYSGEGVVAVVLEDGSLQVLEPATGALRWQERPGWGARLFVALNDGMVIFAGNTFEIKALSVLEGRELWKTTLKGKATSRPVSEAGMLSVSTSDDAVVGIQLKTGKLKWRIEHSPGMFPALMATEKSLVFRTELSLMSVVDIQKGKPLWSVKVERAISNLPAASTNGELFFMTTGGVLIRAAGPETPGPAAPTH